MELSTSKLFSSVPCCWPAGSSSLVNLSKTAQDDTDDQCEYPFQGLDEDLMLEYELADWVESFLIEAVTQSIPRTLEFIDMMGGICDEGSRARRFATCDGGTGGCCIVSWWLSFHRCLQLLCGCEAEPS